MSTAELRDLAYLAAALLFVVDLKWLARPKRAVRGNLIGAVAVALAIAATVAGAPLGWTSIAAGGAAGAIVGLVAALKTKIGAMPELVGVLNGFGAGASVLVAGAALIAAPSALGAGSDAGSWALHARVATAAVALLGAATFFGSYVSFARLAGLLGAGRELAGWKKAVKFGFATATALAGLGYAIKAGAGDRAAAQNAQLFAWLTFLACAAVAALLLLDKRRLPGLDLLKWLAAIGALALGALLAADPSNLALFWLATAVSGLAGLLLALALDRADLPSALALLNSGSGLATAAIGFLLGKSALIVAGALVGAAGVALAGKLRAARGRSMSSLFFARPATVNGAGAPDGRIKETSAEEIALLLQGARRVLLVPGYGMAIAQAQRALHELERRLEERGARVEYAIHPVAGRMPGQMNLLLAEANVAAEKQRALEEVNAEMERIDVALVIGANDIVNPAAESDPLGALAGMAIVQAYKARTVIVINRSAASGFAGVANPLFARDNALFFVADGSSALREIIGALRVA